MACVSARHSLVGTSSWEHGEGRVFFFGGGANRSVIKALMKLRINLWPDLHDIRTEAFKD